MTLERRPELRLECESVLYHEAELLDDGRLDEWLDFLTEDVGYRIPRRVTRERGAEADEFSREGYLLREDYGTLATRVKRLKKEYAWAENPPSRTRRQVSNVRIQAADDGECRLRNNLLLFRNQKDERAQDLVSCEREDTLRRTPDGLKLADRTVYLDQTVFPSKNLSFFL